MPKIVCETHIVCSQCKTDLTASAILQVSQLKDMPAAIIVLCPDCGAEASVTLGWSVALAGEAGTPVDPACSLPGFLDRRRNR